ncbi:MAG: dUTP diphosphatase [Solirubrobacterales bacterium]|nr:dUTP diphosphatase [Solirubrobacterales bacterium]
MQLRFKKLHSDAVVPTQAHAGDAGSDLYAVKGLVLEPGARARVSTGVAVAIPDGHAGLILPRSGLAHKHGITLTNTPGLIDCGYRGELQVLMLNTDREAAYEVKPGDRIAQLVIVAFAAPDWAEVDEFDDTTRGEGGFGSSGF